MDAALLILAVALMLTAFAPVGTDGSTPAALRQRLARQMRLWDRYLGDLQHWR
jgi:hypothetical protein